MSLRTKALDETNDHIYARRIRILDISVACLMIFAVALVGVLQYYGINLVPAILALTIICFVTNMVIYSYSRKMIKFSMRADLALGEIDEIEKEWNELRDQLKKMGIDFQQLSDVTSIVATVNELKPLFNHISHAMKDIDYDMIGAGIEKMLKHLVSYGDSTSPPNKPLTEEELNEL